MSTVWARGPLVLPALAFAVGLAAAPRLPGTLAWATCLGSLGAAAALTWRGRLHGATALLLVAIASTGAIRGIPLPLPPDHVARLPLPLAASVEGRLVAEPVTFAPARTRLLVDVERIDGVRRAGRVQLTAYGAELPGLAEGQRVEAHARLHPAAGFRNPGVFDYGVWLRRQGIWVTGSTRADRLAALEPARPPWHARVRRAAREAMSRALPPTSAALLAGLVLGHRADLPAEVHETFRRAGVYHVLAVSGFNVGLVGGSAFALLTLARLGRRGAAVGAIVVVGGFALVVGPEPSVLRAVVMAVLILGALLLEREAAVPNSLALAGLMILAARPADLFDPGFQLSFAATAGIVMAPLPRGLLAGALGVSLAAQIAVLPIQLVHFNQLPTIAPLANLVVVPLAGLATVLGLLAITLTAVTESGGALFLDAAWPLLLAMRAAAAAAAAVPGALLHLPAPPWAAVAAYGAALALALTAWRRRRDEPSRARLAGAAAAIALVAATGLALWPLVRPLDGRLRVTVLDVGQGDAIVVETPEGAVLLVDAGPGGPMRLDAGERAVAPFLWNRGILRLALAVRSHEDQDHVGGMATVLRDFAVREVWSADEAPAERRWIGGVGARVIRASSAGTGAARRAFPAPARRRNDGALVLRIDHGLASFLLASDIEAATEAALGEADAPLAATVLKVAHHGARGSSTAEFLARVRPRLAVISVGARNAYGHPAPATLERLAAVGARVHRTDRDGAVVFETDGRALTVTRWAARTVERYCLDPEGDCWSK